MQLACRAFNCFFATSLINEYMNIRFCLSYDIEITVKLHFDANTNSRSDFVIMLCNIVVDDWPSYMLLNINFNTWRYIIHSQV